MARDAPAWTGISYVRPMDRPISFRSGDRERISTQLVIKPSSAPDKGEDAIYFKMDYKDVVELVRRYTFYN